ncbi:hypothetical protein ADUPG1_000500, partial [Aduncisulcus paluster]
MDFKLLKDAQDSYIEGNTEKSFAIYQKLIDFEDVDVIKNYVAAGTAAGHAKEILLDEKIVSHVVTADYELAMNLSIAAAIEGDLKLSEHYLKIAQEKEQEEIDEAEEETPEDEHDPYLALHSAALDIASGKRPPLSQLCEWVSEKDDMHLKAIAHMNSKVLLASQKKLKHDTEIQEYLDEIDRDIQEEEISALPKYQIGTYSYCKRMISTKDPVSTSYSFVHIHRARNAIIEKGITVLKALPLVLRLLDCHYLPDALLGACDLCDAAIEAFPKNYHKLGKYGVVKGCDVLQKIRSIGKKIESLKTSYPEHHSFS